MTRKIQNTDFVQLVGDGALGHDAVADGRIVPVLVLDCISRPDLLEVVLFHKDKPPGDVLVTWAKELLNPSRVHLLLEFQRPTVGRAAIEFNLTKHALLVDQIFQTNCIYIQPCNFGVRVSEGVGKPKILVEVQTSGAPFNWNKLYEKYTRKRLIESGMSRSAAKVAAAAFVKESRKLSRMRLM